jgi:hypothetical protein
MDELYRKYKVVKADETPTDCNAVYYVLRLDTDRNARIAARAYAEACKFTSPQLSGDLIALVDAIEHHLLHGDMDGDVCLLSKCAWHYPDKRWEE